MPRVTIYVPDELAQKMKTRPDLNWSAEAQAAFIEAVDRPGPVKLDAKFYGEIRKAKDDSIVPEDQWIVFLAKDDAFAALGTPDIPYSYGAIYQYVRRCRELGCDDQQLKALDRMLTRIQEWRARYPELCKSPDAKDEKLLDENE